MPKFEGFPTGDELVAQHQSKERMSGSNDLSMSAMINGIKLEMNRPGEGEMYTIFLAGKKVGMIGGSTREAEQIFQTALEILDSGASPEEFRRKIGDAVVELHGGIQE